MFSGEEARDQEEQDDRHVQDQVLGQDAEETVVGEQPGNRPGVSAEHVVALSCQHRDEHERDQKKDASHVRDRKEPADVS